MRSRRGDITDEANMSEQTLPLPSNDPAASDDRRTYIRCFCGILASCGPVAPENKVVSPGRIENISEKGLALLLRRRFEPGTSLRLVLRRSDDGFLGLLIANVVRVMPRPNGDWVHGCVLAEVTQSGEYQAV